MKDGMDILINEIFYLEKKIKKLCKALEFYANGNYYFKNKNKIDIEKTSEIAKQALKEVD